MERHDAIIIGGGLNGLTAAAYLARAGADVLLLERNERLGSAAAGFEIRPGFRLPRFTLGNTVMPLQTVIDLDLAKYGLRIIRLDGGITLFADSRSVSNYRDGLMQRRELARFSAKDANAWTRFRRDMLRANMALRDVLDHPMRNPARRSLAALRGLLGSADRLAKKPGEDLHALLRLWSMSCVDFLDSYFTSDIVKAHLAGMALGGTTLGPFAPASAWHLLSLFSSDAEGASGGAPATVLAVGGPEACANALAASIEAHGGHIRTEAEVTDVLLREGKAHGVALANGEELYARTVLSDLDLKRTFLTLFPWKDLPKGFVERVGRFRMRGISAKVNLALDIMPDFPDLSEGSPALAGGLRFGLSMDELEQAFDDWRDHLPPRGPLIETLIPSMADRSLAPTGCHVMSVCIHYVPEILHDGVWTPERKDELTSLVIDRIAMQSPGFKDRILSVETLVPPDIESEVGLTAGDFHQGEMALDQMFFNRPMPDLAGYETPIANFFLCSDSIHPGALETGGAGAGAAARVTVALGRTVGSRRKGLVS